jgi:formylglycine-generating enzyme required for sulfatase activity/predicted Ser/Thr protein kinase
MWQANQTIKDGRFLIQKVLGGGGFGVAFQALDRKHNHPVVIKTLNQHQQLQPGFDALQEKFVNEAMTLKGLSHPHIVKVYELIQEQRLWGMVMEYIDGQELAEYLEERGALTEAEALNYIEQVGKALIYTHQQKVIHRDIKPHNIMLRAGNREAVLIDFGLAREYIDGKTLTMTNSLTQAYAPIEQYDRQGHFGPYTDVYALAATLYHLLTGTPPLPSNYRQLNYPLSPPTSLNPQISQVVAAGIMGGLELQPQNRPQSIEEFLQLLGVGSPASVVSTSLEDAKAYFDRAFLKEDNLKDFQGALADYNQAIALNPNYVLAYHNRGVLKQNQFNDPQGALADYDRAIVFDPNYADAYSNRGLLKETKFNDIQGALADYNQAIVLDPNFAIAYSSRANLKKDNLNDFQGALADYDRALAIDPNYALAYHNRGLLKHNNLNDSQGALSDYDRAIALNPNDALCYYNRGDLKYYNLNDVQGALADYDRALAIDPNYAIAYGSRASLKKNKLNDIQGALVDYNQAIALNPNYAIAYNNRALLKHNNLNDIQGALVDYNQALAIDPNFAIAYNNRANLNKDNLNDIQGALVDYNQAIILNPNDAEAYRNRGLLKHYLLKDYQGALLDYNQALSLNPGYAFAYVNRANLKKDNLNDPQGALVDYDRAIALDPNNASNYHDRALLKHNNLNDPQGTLADYNQAIALNPNYAVVYRNRGVLKCYNFNDPQGALADYDQSVTLNPNDALAYHNRAVLKHNNLNDPQGTLADYNQAIALNPNDAEAYRNRGLLKHYLLNDYQGALLDYNQALSLNPNDTDAYNNRANLKKNQLRDLQGTLADYNQTVQSPAIAQPQPNNLPKLTTIQFTSVKLNSEGTIVDRPSGSAEIFTEDLGNSVELTMVKIPAGKFLMGSPESEQERNRDESPQHPVSVPEFYLGQTPITQAEYQAIMGDNPSSFQDNDKLPVQYVNWLEAMDFCEKLSQKTGKTYRLPSEAEWEYACRAGSSTPFAFGETITPEVVNYNGRPYGGGAKGESRLITTPVGTFPPNLFGLYDLHGNVYEWCLDEWVENYHGAPTDGSARGDIRSRDENKMRLLRGGSWFYNASRCRSASRCSYIALFCNNDIGFRVVSVLSKTV